jgi:hypothetical protein
MKEADVYPEPLVPGKSEIAMMPRVSGQNFPNHLRPFDP